jgi:hypothetical protein
LLSQVAVAVVPAIQTLTGNTLVVVVQVVLEPVLDCLSLAALNTQLQLAVVVLEVMASLALTVMQTAPALQVLILCLALSHLMVVAVVRVVGREIAETD